MDADPAAGAAGGGAGRRPHIRVVIVTRNSARWLGIILDQYRAMDLAPFVMLDSSSEDGTAELLRRRGVEHATVRAEGPRVETMIRLIPAHVEAEWVLRLDDDELPSRELRRFVAARLRWLQHDVVGFPRRWLRLTEAGICEYSRHPQIVSPRGVLDAQWRLFRPRALRYRTDIHTPGFHVPAGSPIAPDRAFIAHFSWLVRGAGERRRQVEDYDRQAPQAGTRFHAIKVWEDSDPADHRFAAMETDEFAACAAALAATIGDRAVQAR